MPHMVGIVEVTPNIERLVEEYAQVVHSDFDSYSRGLVHDRLCNVLGFDYATFKPFESESILHVLSVRKCREMIWQAIRDYVHPLDLVVDPLNPEDLILTTPTIAVRYDDGMSYED